MVIGVSVSEISVSPLAAITPYIATYINIKGQVILDMLWHLLNCRVAVIIVIINNNIF